MKYKRQAQEELYDRFSGMVKGITLRYSKDDSQAEDMVQEAYMKIFQKLETYNASGELGAWIRKIAVNTALEILRKKEHLVYRDNITTEDEVDVSFLKKMELEDLVEKIQSLPSGFRTVFNLYAVEGYNHKEIADLLNITEGTSKSQYSRAKTALKNMIKEKEKVKG